MSLSTSNSNLKEAEPMHTRKQYAKIIFAMFAGMAVAMLIIRGVLELQGANKQGILGRVAEAQSALDKITQEPNELVMFYGSSMTRAGFSPRKFDKELAEQGKAITSFNFGFGGLNPFYQDLLSRRIGEHFVKEDRRLKLALIEFNPFQTTTTRWQRAKFTVDSFVTMLSTDEELLEIAKQDITRGIRLFNIKYMRGDISAEMITSYYGQALFPTRPRQQFEDTDEVHKKGRELGKKLGEKFEEEYPDYKGEEWSYAWQGGGTIPEERSEETLKLFEEYYNVVLSDAQMKNDRLSRIRTADIEEMNFEPLLVESFIQIIKNFQQFSDKVEVVMLPRNTKWINYSAEGKKRLAQAVKEIEAATGITIVDHRELDEINPDMFSDTTHLARYRGDIAYTDYLIKTYAPEL